MKKTELNFHVHEMIKKLLQLDLVDKDTTGVFSVRDCVLTQHFTGKSYSYRAFNIRTGESKYLFRQKKTISKDKYAYAVELMKQLPFYDVRLFSSGEEMIRHIFYDIFLKYGYSVRDNQVDLSIKIYQNMQSNSICLSDVSVGLGKTHAYLVASIVNAKFEKRDLSINNPPTIITTSSIELQKAIVNDYLPNISKMLLSEGLITSEIKCILRKGKSHYICHKRLKHYVTTLKGTNKNEVELRKLEDLCNRDEIEVEKVGGISNYDKRKICVMKSECFICYRKNKCLYQKFINKAKSNKYDYQVCNHNYYLADVLKRKKGLSALVPIHKDVVIDEAHKLLEAAQTMYGVKIVEFELKNLIKKAIPKYVQNKANKYMKKACLSALKQVNRLFLKLRKQVINTDKNQDINQYSVQLTNQIMTQIKLLLLELKDVKNRLPLHNNLLSMDFNEMIDCIRSIDNDKDICWIENITSSNQCVLVAVPKHLNVILRDDLWNQNKSYTLTSGTLAIDNNFSYVKKKLGLNQINQSKIMELFKTSPFDYMQNCMIYMPQEMSYPDVENDCYIQKVSEEISSLIKTSNGHALVLFTSYKQLKLVYNNVERVIENIPLFELGKGKSDVVNQYRNSKKGVLFATGSMWEGINIPGDILSHLIIVKLPFPAPDPISEYESKLYCSQDQFMNQNLLPKMLMKLKQGVGRLIRSEFDTGIVSIIDSRAIQRGKYHSKVINSLPLCKITTKQSEIRDFLIKHKNEDYFIR